MSWLKSLFGSQAPAADEPESNPPTEKAAAPGAAPDDFSPEEQLGIDSVRSLIGAIEEIFRRPREARPRLEVLRDMRDVRWRVKEIERLSASYPIEVTNIDQIIELVCQVEKEANSEATPHERAKRWLEGCLILDTETTGLSEWDEIVEIAIIDHLGDVKFSSTVRPTCRISPEAAAVHGITDDAVAGSPSWAGIHRKVMSLLRMETVVSYNAEFDMRMLRQTAMRSGKECGPLQIECAMTAYAEYYGDWDNRRESWLLQSLGRAATQQGITVDGQLHRALADCRTTLALVQAMAARPVHVARYPDDLEALSMSRARVSFGVLVDACVRYATFSGWNASRTAAEERAEAWLHKRLGYPGEALYWSETGIDGLDQWKKNRASTSSSTTMNASVTPTVTASSSGMARTLSKCRCGQLFLPVEWVPARAAGYCSVSCWPAAKART